MDPFLGEIRIFGGNFAPVGWAICDGSLLPIAQNTALFSILGTMYGGNGTTNFALPDLRGRVVVGVGQGQGLSPYVQGQMGGTETQTLTVLQMPAHSHSVSATETNASSDDPKAAVLAKLGNLKIYGAGPDGTVMNSAMIGPTGGGQPISTLQPFLVINYIIALTGVYPSRG
jgi:microcystin-dependent protein